MLKYRAEWYMSDESKLRWDAPLEGGEWSSQAPLGRVGCVDFEKSVEALKRILHWRTQGHFKTCRIIDSETGEELIHPHTPNELLETLDWESVRAWTIIRQGIVERSSDDRAELALQLLEELV